MLVNTALLIAAEAHDGQFYGEIPYINHPIDVWRRAKNIFKDKFSDKDEAIAILHDTIEDTFVTSDYLIAKGIPAYSIAGIQLVSKVPELSYEQNIQRIIDSGHLGAAMTKYADNRVNYYGDKKHMSPARVKKLTEQYIMSMDMLEEYLATKNIGI